MRRHIDWISLILNFQLMYRINLEMSDGYVMTNNPVALSQSVRPSRVSGSQRAHDQLPGLLSGLLFGRPDPSFHIYFCISSRLACRPRSLCIQDSEEFFHCPTMSRTEKKRWREKERGRETKGWGKRNVLRFPVPWDYHPNIMRCN